ncbi:MAG: DUF697 domain-containing protein [Saprospiraceae bacterium]
METTINKDLIDSIIKEKMFLSMGAGIIPIPMIDILAVSAIQVSMVRQLSRAFGIDYKESDGKALITALTGASVARLGGSLIKAIPGVGSFIGGATTSLLSAASTYAIGEVFKKHFETGGTFLDFDLASLKKYYDEKFEKGKDVVGQMKKDKTNKSGKSPTSTANNPAPMDETIAARLREYVQLKEAGVLTTAEYNKLKIRLLNTD